MINEDTCGFCNYDKNLVFVLADGLGGHGDGKKASEIACRELMQCGADERVVTRKDLANAFDRANQMILREHKNDFHMKTTAVYLCLRDDQAIWGHLGDSRLYHFYNGELKEVTLDHSMAQLAVHMGEIKREDIPRYPGRSRIFHALGCEGEELSSVGKVKLKEGKHAFFLCSDGVWELISDEVLQQHLEQSETAAEWIKKIRQTVEENMPPQHDNHSAIAVMMDGIMYDM